MTPEERARLRELAERATAGPWDAHRPHPAYRQYVVDRVMPEGHLGETVATTEDVQASENAEYIAAVSPDVVLGILDALNAAEAERDRLAKAVERVRALAEGWRYKGEHGYGPWQAGSGPSPDGEALDWASSLILRALDGGE